ASLAESGPSRTTSTSAPAARACGTTESSATARYGARSRVGTTIDAVGIAIAECRNHPALGRPREQVHASDELLQGRVADRATTVRQALPADRPDLVGLGVGDVGEPAFGRVDPKVERRPVGPSERDDDGELAGALAEP